MHISGLHNDLTLKLKMAAHFGDFWGDFVPLRDFIQNRQRVFVLGSNGSSAHDELNNIQCKYTEIISVVNKVDAYV